jgi:hypothetical protein
MMRRLLSRSPRLLNAARRATGALGRFFDKIVVRGPATHDPDEIWPIFPPY